MFNSKKSQYGRLLSTLPCMFLLLIFTLSVVAEENYGNLPPDLNMMGMSLLEGIDLPFDPNVYTFLIYNPGGGEASIEQTMDLLGIHYDERDFSDGNEVTPNDLATHDILIVGWNYYGDTSGLHSDDLATGITGRVILSGHDLDFHTADPYYPIPAAQKMLIQAIDYVLAGGGTGMITLGCTGGFPYLPEEWDVNALPSGGDIITEFTSEGLASGVYDGLDLYDMCNWGMSYHDVFTIDQDSAFVQFELGGDGDDIITVARLWSGCGVELTKTDAVNDGNCVLPGDYITYTINYANPTVETLTDVNIIDYLPDDLVFSSASGPNSVYHPSTHTVTWDIGTLEPNESGSVTLTVKVNECILECGAITNSCIIKSGDWTLNGACESTPVCSASNPNPTCGAIVDLDTGEFNLTWCPGRFAADSNGHEVYFGSNFNDVNDANNSWPIGEVYKGPNTNPSYPLPLGSLDKGTTYYWRIDEVNTAHPDLIWPVSPSTKLSKNYTK